MAGGTFRLEHVMLVVDKVSSSAQFPLADAAALDPEDSTCPSDG